jgi:3-deoxy-manno-octulosonate cytidylyltransferase (CMP-KDO synthetase)
MIVALIPARYQSSRLPGKPLLKFGNETMIQKVYKQTIKSKLISKTYVLTDDERIKESIEEINGRCLIVKDNCLNGTERICIAIKRYSSLFENVDFIVNVQGDEPFIKPDHIDLSINKIISSKDKNVVCSTLHYQINDNSDLKNSSIGKLVLDNNNHILYCSRSCIPTNKEGKHDVSKCDYYGHIGLFVYDFKYLINEYMKKNTPLQLEEDIEWLKILEQGHKIKSSCVKDYEIGVNLIEDYNYLIDKYKLTKSLTK